MAKKKEDNSENLHIEIKKNLASIFKEFQSIESPGIAELKIFELKVSILKEILKMSSEINKKNGQNKEKTKEKDDSNKFITADLIQMINDTFYSNILNISNEIDQNEIEDKKD